MSICKSDPFFDIFQISVPIQSGNSGGPLLTREGNVIGVVVAKLSAARMLRQTGDVTENVNYAVKSKYLIELAQAAGLKSKLLPAKSTPLDLETVAAAAEPAVILVLATSTGKPDSTTPGRPQVSQEKPGRTFTDCEGCPELVVIPAGVFTMGSNSGYAYQGPARRVTIREPFAMGKYEVTQGQWRAIMGDNPSKFPYCGDDCPVENASWHDAQRFLEKLSEKTGKQYRLPSEAEWEYACKANQNYEYCGGDNADSIAWTKENSGGTPHLVGTKKPNAFGLYDMIGKIGEWVADSWSQGYEGAPTDGSARRGGLMQKVTRGGSFAYSPHSAMDRGGVPPGFRDKMGFRVTRNLP